MTKCFVFVFVEIPLLNCKLPSFATWRNFDEILPEDPDPHQGMDCTIIDETMFDILCQPVEDQMKISLEDFDKIQTLNQTLNPQPSSPPSSQPIPGKPKHPNLAMFPQLLTR